MNLISASSFSPALFISSFCASIILAQLLVWMYSRLVGTSQREKECDVVLVLLTASSELVVQINSCCGTHCGGGCH